MPALQVAVTAALFCLTVFVVPGESQYVNYGVEAPQGSSPYNVSLDVSILNYALTLEHLEAAFYVQALQKYSKAQFDAAGFSDQDYQVISLVRDHEVTHVSFLQSAIAAAGGQAVPPCSYNFPGDDVETFLIIAAALEETGVAAYLGAAGDISNPAYLGAAATILTVEARHAAFFKYIQDRAPAPNAFDIPLNSRSIITIASPFITSCNFTLPMPYEALTTSVSRGAPGGTVGLTYNGGDGTEHCHWLIPGGSADSPIINRSCVVPASLVPGEVYLMVATGEGGNNVGVAGPTFFTITGSGGNGGSATTMAYGSSAQTSIQTTRRDQRATTTPGPSAENTPAYTTMGAQVTTQAQTTPAPHPTPSVTVTEGTTTQAYSTMGAQVTTQAPTTSSAVVTDAVTTQAYSTMGVQATTSANVHVEVTTQAPTTPAAEVTTQAYSTMAAQQTTGAPATYEVTTQGYVVRAALASLAKSKVREARKKNRIVAPSFLRNSKIVKEKTHGLFRKPSFFKIANSVSGRKQLLPFMSESEGHIFARTL